MLVLYLKKVEIQGFKSFADKTEIEFKNEVTAIVGPNGSGKSNISDAIRWVLGEQSVKNLRGSKMEDVIFAGTDSRRALGYAEVTIVFNNESGLMPIDYTEVAVTRRMFRSGESEFYINKNSCRLKDVRELFMDSGIGKDGYSIIGQGKIDEILSNRPEDRRNIFEEAAGIVKFRNKKEESERKLERTEANIVRIKDLIHEISNQKVVLEKESQRAELFTKLFNQLRDLEVNIFIREIRKLEVQIKDLSQDKETLSGDLAIIEEEKNQIDGKYNLIKSNIEDMEKEIEDSRTLKFDRIQEYEANKNQLNIFIEKEGFLSKDLQRLKSEKENAIRRLEDLEISIVGIGKKLNEIDINLGNVLKERDLSIEELKFFNQKVLSEESRLDEDKKHIIKLYNQASDKKSEINSINLLKLNIEKRIEQLNGDLDLDKDKLDKSLLKEEELREEVLNLRDKLKEENDKLELLSRERTKIVNELEGVNKALRSQQMKLNELQTNYRLYSNMESSYEGYYKSVKSIIKNSKRDENFNKGLIGIVADLLKVDSMYARAIDIALASSAQNVIIEREEDAKKFVDFLKVNKSGRATFLPLSVMKGKTIVLDEKFKKDFNILGVAYELIDYDPKLKGIFEYLLGRTIIVKDMDSGIRLARNQKHMYKIVTLDGEVLNAGGSISGGSYANESLSLISRKSKIEELKLEIQNLESSILETEKIASSIENKSESILSETSLINQNIKSFDLQLIDLNNSLNLITNDIKRIRSDIEKSKEESNSLIMEMDNFKSNIVEIEKVYNQLEEEIEELKTISENKNAKLSELKSKCDEINKQETDYRILISQLETSKISMESQLKSYEITKISSESEISKIECNLKSISDEIGIISIKKVEIEKNIIEYESSEDDISQRLNLLVKEKDNFMKTFYEEQDRLKIINTKISELEKQSASLEVKMARFEFQLDNTHTKLHEDYDLKFDDAVRFERDIDSIHKSQTEVKGLKDKIKSLGNVNISAIEDFKHISERFEFISKQHEDLILSKDNLREVIKDMEKQMKLKFVDSFREINAHFTEVFAVLFNGGKASLELEDGEDILKSGIDIRVQPPGKKLQSLSLLSGGEKSLTAVALLFAILRTKPSPFCVLDEIDAALDEANISRYTSYLNKIKDRTQFILITHRKTTMEIADVLYGITMEDEGVSKLISIKLKDKLVEAS